MSKFYVNAKSLSNALTIVGRAISNKPTHPILGCVRLYAKGEIGRVCGFDLSTAIVKGFTVDSQGDAVTDICIPYQLFATIIGKLDGDILINVDTERLTIESDTGRYEVSCLSSDDYPDLPQLDGEAINLSGDTLREAIATVASSASDDELKQILCGINLTTDKGRLYFNATNGHTLARYWSDGCQDELSVTIPVSALLSVAKGTSGDVEMVLGEQQVKFLSGDLTIIARVLDGTYPAVSQLIPVQFDKIIIVDATKLKSALSRLTAFADPKNNLIVFILSDGKITVQTPSSDFGQGQESIPCDYSGDDFEIAFNFKYVNAGINAVNSKEIKLSMNAANSPAIFTGGANNLFLLMPVQIVK